MIEIPMNRVKAGLILAGAHLALLVTALITGEDGDVPFFYCASLIVGLFGAPLHPHPEVAGPGLGVLLSLAVMLPGRWPTLPLLVFSVAQLMATGLVSMLLLIMAHGPVGPGALGVLALWLLIPLLHGGGIALVMLSRGAPGPEAAAAAPTPAGLVDEPIR